MTKDALVTALDKKVNDRPHPNLKRYLPFLDWLLHYRVEYLSGDLIAGIVVAITLVPQGMAYALLAGLPPQVGLYASIVPLAIYGLLGSSRALAVGPVAIGSLVVAAGVAPLAGNDAALYVQLALTLALLVGLINVAMGLLRVGFLVNFLSYPVLVGFTAAAAIVIGFSQIKYVLGFDVPRSAFTQTVQYTLLHLGQTNFVTLLLGLVGIAVLLFFKLRLGDLLQRWGWGKQLIIPATKAAPLVIVLLGIMAVRAFRLDEWANVGIVGNVPAGLPPLTAPLLDLGTWWLLVPTALTITFLNYMESISVAKSLASRRREKVDADQELLALGAANLGAAFTGGYPVGGAFSRSVVNYDAGARTGLASLITAGLMALTVLFLIPLFFYLPQAVLAAIILVAVANLIDLKTARHIWRYNKADAAALIATFLSVLLLGIESGILMGVGVSLVLYIWRTSNPHIAEIGRLGQSEMYRNVLRYHVQTWAHVLLIRVDESLYFANTKAIEDSVLRRVAERPAIKHLVLTGSAINFIDASALETLRALHAELENAGVALHLAEINEPVLDKLRAIGFVEEIGEARVHFSTHDALIALGLASATDGDHRSPGESALALQKDQVGG